MDIAALILASAIGGAPSMSMRAVPTGYGQYGCLQRAQQRLYGAGATGVNSSSNSVYGALGDNAVLVWCRGHEAVTAVAGPQAADLADQVRSAF